MLSSPRYPLSPTSFHTNSYRPHDQLTSLAAIVRIAADGGANRVYAIKEHFAEAAVAARSTTTKSFPKLDFIIGDLDSLRAETRSWFLEQQQQQRQDGASTNGGGEEEQGRIIQLDDQDSTDFAKAVKHAQGLARLRRGRRRQKQQQKGKGEEKKVNGGDAKKEGGEEDIICYSGLGGRVDQAMSQLHHLYMFQRRRRPSEETVEGNESYEDNSGNQDGEGVDNDEVEGQGEGEGEGGYAGGRMYLTNGESLTFVLLSGQRHRIRIRDGLPAMDESLPSSSPPAYATTPSTKNPNSHGKEDRDNEKNDEENSSVRNKDTHEDAKDVENGEENPRTTTMTTTTFGKHVGIIPLAGPSRLTTRGLRWDVTGWRTVFGGRLSTSNHTMPGTDIVEIEAGLRDVLFTIDIPCSFPFSAVSSE